MKLYRFTGDVKKLIPLGYKFQKLYASNYRSYTKGKIIMFVTSKMILVIDGVKPEDQSTLIKFILDNASQPDTFWQYQITFELLSSSIFANWRLQDGIVVSKEAATAKKIAYYSRFELDENTPYQEDGLHIDFKLVTTILELNEIYPLQIMEV